MTTNAIAGVGTLFKRAITDSSGALYETIAEINGITGPNISRTTIDVTSLDSVGGVREFIGSFRDSGEIALEMNFTRDNYIKFKEDLESNTLKAYQIVFPDDGATTLDFSGLVTALGAAIPLDDKITQTVSIKISGAVSLSS